MCPYTSSNMRTIVTFVIIRITIIITIIPCFHLPLIDLNNVLLDLPNARTI